MNKPAGGPAFARPATMHPTRGGELFPSQVGMSMRDYYAGQALAGLLANPGTQGAGPEMMPMIAQVAFAMADAMIQERMKPRD